MSEFTAAPVPGEGQENQPGKNVSPGYRRSLLERLRGNPIIVKELRSRMRGSRAYLVISLYLLFISLILGLIYLAFLSSSQQSRSVTDLQVMGKVLFGAVVWLQLITVSFVAPSLTAGSIASEREHQTYDLLRTTLLPARALVLGKFFSGLLFILLLLFAGLPLQSLAFLFGGVAAQEFWIATVLLIVTAIAFCASGIFFSSFLRRTLISTILAAAFTILMVFGLPMLMVFFLALFQSQFGNWTSNLQPVQETMLIIGGLLLVATNPLAVAVATEAFLLEQQSAFLLKFPLSNGNQVTLISPWILYTVLYLLLSLVLLGLSTYFVKRPER